MPLSYNSQPSSAPPPSQSETLVTAKSTTKHWNATYSFTSNSGNASSATPTATATTTDGNGGNHVGVSNFDGRPKLNDGRQRASSLTNGGNYHTRVPQKSYSQPPYRATTLLPHKQQYLSAAPRSIQAPSQQHSLTQQQRLTTYSSCNGSTPKSQVSRQAPSMATTMTAAKFPAAATAAVAVASPISFHSQPLSSSPAISSVNVTPSYRPNNTMPPGNIDSSSSIIITKTNGQNDSCNVAQQGHLKQDGSKQEKQHCNNSSSINTSNTDSLPKNNMNTKSLVNNGVDLSNITSIERLNRINNDPVNIVVTKPPINNMNTNNQNKSNTTSINNNDQNRTNNNNINNNYDINVANVNAINPNETSRPAFNGPYVRKKSRPKKNPIVVSPDPPPSTKKTHGGIWTTGKFDTRGSPLVSTPFDWDLYMKISPFKVAPKEAFRQPEVYPTNTFKVGMKLEAKDPRNSNNWCLASVVGIEALHLKLRFEGSDAMNDLYELVDSENIRSVGAQPGDLLLPPTGFKGNLAQYPKFVEKVLKDESTIIAPPECFPPTPPKLTRNLFQTGMKLEAVDRKHRDLICVATIGEVNGSTVKIVFDGWRGSFDYSCEFSSRDLFPIKWCESVGRPIQPPNGWESLITKELAMPSTLASTPPKDSTPDLASNSPSSRDSSLPHSGEKTPSKKRGRPIKHTSPQMSDSQIDTTMTNTKLVISSTPKKKDIKQDVSMEQSVETPVSEEKFQKPDDDRTVNDQSTNKYQCQRTVSYSDWKKKQENQMPQEPSNSDIKIHNAANNSSFNLSDSVSMVSSLSYQQDPEELPAPKKIKTSSASCTLEDKPSDKLVDKPCDEPDDKPMDRRAQVIDGKQKNLSSWTVDDILDLIRTEDSLIKYSPVFVEHEIDGKAFILLTTDILINHMGLKIGPVLKINDLIEQVKRQISI